MTQIIKTSAKTYFETGDKPTQAQFGDLIDSCAFLAETSTQAFAGNITVSGNHIVAGNVTVSGTVTATGGGTLDSFTVLTPTVSGGTFNLGTFDTPTIKTPVVSAGTFTSPSITGGTVTSASIVSPAITGVATAPTAAKDENTTQLATTAFVLNQAASAATMEAGTALTEYVSPGLQQRHQSAAKAFVTFASTGASLRSYNVTGVSNVATGQYTVTYTNVFSDRNYSLFITVASPTSAATQLAPYYNATTKASASTEIFFRNATPAFINPTEACLIAYGDL